MVEHGLGYLPFSNCSVTTPTGEEYQGVQFSQGLCGVSVIRSGESMENALRACCKGVKIGKILIRRRGEEGAEEDSAPCKIIYEKLPLDISRRFVLLLDPILASGNSAIAAIDMLLAKGVAEERIIFLTLVAAPQGICAVCERYPHLTLVTSEIDAGLSPTHVVVPGVGEFGDSASPRRLSAGQPRADCPAALAGYFGTDAWSAAFVEQHEKEEEGRMSSSSLPALDSLRIAPAAASEAETAGAFPSQTPR